jgi:hypothetical protein
MLEKRGITKPQMVVQICVCIWIIAANFIVNMLDLPEHGIHFANWCFFMINIIFFLSGEPDMKKRFVHTLVGSLVGIVLAGLTTLGLALLWTEQGMGGKMSYLPSLMIPLSICLILLIVFHPIFPAVFNNCGFVYYLTSLTVMGAMPWGGNALSNVPSYLICTILGHFIVNGVSLLIIGAVQKHYVNKAKAAAQMNLS